MNYNNSMWDLIKVGEKLGEYKELLRKYEEYLLETELEGNKVNKKLLSKQKADEEFVYFLENIINKMYGEAIQLGIGMDKELFLREPQRAKDKVRVKLRSTGEVHTVNQINYVDEEVSILSLPDSAFDGNTQKTFHIQVRSWDEVEFVL